MSLADDLATAQNLRDQLARVNARITDVTINRPQTASDFAELGNMQAKADSTYRKLGWNAPAALPGETRLMYRRRLIGNLLPKAPNFKDMPILDAPDAVLNVFEPQVYADAEQEARRPTMLEPGELREVASVSDSGVRTSEFFGKFDDAMSAFKQPIRLAKIFDPRRREGF